VEGAGAKELEKSSPGSKLADCSGSVFGGGKVDSAEYFSIDSMAT